jgi:hypothetical protein
MTFDEIERRLRLPAPDEPAMLPALVLPVRVSTATLPDRTIELRLGRRQRRVPALMLATGLLLAAAVVGAVLVGAFRLEQLRDALPIPGLYTGRGITIDYPDGWHRLTPHDPIGNSGSWVAVIVGNREVAGCEADSDAVERNSPPPEPTVAPDGNYYGGDQTGVIYHLEDRIYACLIEQPMEPGEVRIVVSRDRPQAIAVGPFGDFAGSYLAPNPEVGGPVLVSAETGFTESIGQMPAQVIVRDRSVVPGAEQLRTWLVAIPDSAESLWWIQAVLRGPDLATLEAEVDAVARSLTFDEEPVPLDAADRDGALAAAVDEVDRQMRAYPGRRFLECLPRTPGSVETTIDDGPRGRLSTPLAVTCSTTVEDVDLRVWSATIEVAWAATGDAPAGRWAQEILFDGSGAMLQQTDLAPGTGDAAAFPGDPGDVEPPSEVATFRPGDLVRSVGAGAQTAVYDVESALLPPEPHLFLDVGGLAVILSGPETFDGRDFYMADNGFEVGWIGAEAKNRVVLMGAEPRCPAVVDVVSLMYLSSLERRLCVSGELTLGPVQAGQPERDPGWDQIEASPAWLAAHPTWALYGVGGRDGLDAGLPVALGPGLSDLPTDGWLEVTGHFDDPASATCVITYPEEWNPAAGTADAHIRRCLERFVVTSAIPTEAPR